MYQTHRMTLDHHGSSSLPTPLGPFSRSRPLDPSSRFLPCTHTSIYPAKNMFEDASDVVPCPSLQTPGAESGQLCLPCSPHFPPILLTQQSSPYLIIPLLFLQCNRILPYHAQSNQPILGQKTKTKPSRHGITSEGRVCLYPPPHMRNPMDTNTWTMLCLASLRPFRFPTLSTILDSQDWPEQNRVETGTETGTINCLFQVPDFCLYSNAQRSI